MSETLLPMVEEEWRKPPLHWEHEGRSLMTELGVVGGEALTYLEARGATTLRQLIRELEWPAPMVMMAVGALVREGLVRAIRHELEVVVEVRGG
ncbi:MAG: hypothetical protein HYY91_06105 [Candidatus Omnitrophica bacterium]|nr:hypothetical protein [Candidatus Omnitrophota bacterium]